MNISHNTNGCRFYTDLRRTFAVMNAAHRHQLADFGDTMYEDRIRLARLRDKIMSAQDAATLFRTA